MRCIEIPILPPPSVYDPHRWPVIEAEAAEIQNTLNVLVVAPRKSNDFMFVIGKDVIKHTVL
jgi:hypothetical protein